MILRIAILLILFCTTVQAKHIQPEKYYQNIWCRENNGIQEYKLIDDTRVDCLTKTHAIEFDFASKWAEAVGQSLHYSNLTSKMAGIVLIIEKPSDYKHYNKVEKLSKKYNIALWQMKAQDYNNYICEIDIIELIFEWLQKLLQFLSRFL